MNPMDVPEQRDAYIAQQKITAQSIMDDLRKERGTYSPTKRQGFVIGISGPVGGMQAVDNIDA